MVPTQGEHLTSSKTFTAVVARLTSLFGMSMVDCPLAGGVHGLSYQSPQQKIEQFNPKRVVPLLCQITRHVYVVPFNGALTRIHIFKLVSCAAFCADEGPRGAVFRSLRFLFGMKLRLRLGQRLPASWSQYVNIMLVPNMVPSVGPFSLHGFCKHGSLTSISTCHKNP